MTEREINEIDQIAKAKIKMRIGPVNLAACGSTRTLVIRHIKNKKTGGKKTSHKNG